MKLEYSLQFFLNFVSHFFMNPVGSVVQINNNMLCHLDSSYMTNWMEPQIIQYMDFMSCFAQNFKSLTVFPYLTYLKTLLNSTFFEQLKTQIHFNMMCSEILENLQTKKTCCEKVALTRLCGATL